MLSGEPGAPREDVAQQGPEDGFASIQIVLARLDPGVLGEQERFKIAMDLWEPYFNSTLAHVPEAAGKIVHDPYHLGRMLSEAVDKVRRAEHRVLMESGDDRLAGTKHVWLYGWDNVDLAAEGLANGSRVASLNHH